MLKIVQDFFESIYIHMSPTDIDKYLNYSQIIIGIPGPDNLSLKLVELSLLRFPKPTDGTSTVITLPN